ncbi:lytic transglycosylase domain-containing protein [Komagataeibacter sp. FNDCR2]|uniref:lytic transglycosylase domain-containing protein n=1 Tax=Komagataeibacter sp. FNDCR2 TaxID=2878682 RepID=UPI001E523E39|nr:lytic transglycosylase domain-containing protein [Komagataeibacter sp. FNDCR2]MCE2576024.1 transglycosylase SLT domain-containing protein [Komagataeibacter sp. FNDCR2]
MASGFTITISAVDKASSVMNNITKRVNAMNAPVRRFRGAFGRFMDATGVRRVAGAFRDWTAAGLGTASSLLKIIEPMGVLTGAASIAGLYRLTTAWAQFGTRLGFDAQRIGILPDKLQALQGAAEEAGSSAGSMTSGLRTLHDNMVDAIGGRNNQALLYFRQLGINIGDMKNGARSAIQVMPELADKIASIRNPTLQARVATQLLGSAGEDLLPYFRLGSKGMQQLEEDARNLGLTNQAGVRASYQLQLAQVRLGLATRGLAYSIAEQAGPGLKSLLDWFTDLIAKNREAIAARIGHAVQTFAKWIMSVDWRQIGDDIADIADDAQSVADSLGGWEAVAKDVGKVMMAALIGKMLLGLGMTLARIVQVTLAIKTMRALARTAEAEAAASGAAGAASGAGARVATSASSAEGIAAGAATGGMLSRLGRYGRTGLRWGGRALGTAAMAGLAYDVWENVFTGGDHLASNDTVIRGGPLHSDVAAEAQLAATRHGIDPDRFSSLLQTEGGGYRNVSGAGAFGPAQLMPGTAAGLGLPASINDPRYTWQGNLEGGARYFRQMLDLFHGNYEAAEAAYNAGPNNAGVQRYATTGDASGLPRETQDYVASIDALTKSAKRMRADAASHGKDASAASRAPTWNDFSRRMVVELRVHDDNPRRSSPRISVKSARMAGGGPGPKIQTAMPAEPI